MKGYGEEIDVKMYIKLKFIVDFICSIGYN